MWQRGVWACGTGACGSEARVSEVCGRVTEGRVGARQRDSGGGGGAAPRVLDHIDGAGVAAALTLPR